MLKSVALSVRLQILQVFTSQTRARVGRQVVARLRPAIEGIRAGAFVVLENLNHTCLASELFTDDNDLLGRFYHFSRDVSGSTLLYKIY